MIEPSKGPLVTLPATEIDPKVTAAGVGGSAATVLVFVADLAGVELPPYVAAAVVTVAAFVAGYVKRTRVPRGKHRG